jgi:hypothetical protein
MEMVRDPRALCVSSRQFLTLGLANQLEHVLAAFPSAISHNRVFDAMSTREALTREKKVDIVHIAAFVCPRSGTLYFSDVDLRTGKPSSDVPRDTIEPDDLEPVTKCSWAVAHPQRNESGSLGGAMRAGQRSRVTGAIEPGTKWTRVLRPRHPKLLPPPTRDEEHAR